MGWMTLSHEILGPYGHNDLFIFDIIPSEYNSYGM